MHNFVSLRRVVDQPIATQEDLGNDLKAAGSTVTEDTFGNTLQILERPQGHPAQEGICIGPSLTCL